jgi:hypothetical protein
MTGGTSPYVFSLLSHRGELVAGGPFTTAGGVITNGIARWNGVSWQSLGSGFGGTSQPRVFSLTEHDGRLIAGGEFITAGGVLSTYWARWGVECPADLNCDGFLDGIDYDLFNNAWESGSPDADINADGFLDGIDYDLFNNQFESGCL